MALNELEWQVFHDMENKGSTKIEYKMENTENHLKQKIF